MKALALALLFWCMTAQAWAGYTWTDNEKRISVSYTWKLTEQESDYFQVSFEYEERDGTPTFIWGGLKAIGDWDTRRFWERVYKAITTGG